jgi:P4 family phage/plasmid primase-like protien
MILHEIVDIIKINNVINCSNIPISNDPHKSNETIKKTLQLYLKNNGKVTYKRHKNFGRDYAENGCSLQSFPKEIRKYISNDNYVDLDVINCHPVILEQLFQKYNIDVPQFISEYNLNRESTIKKYNFNDKLDVIKLINNETYTGIDLVMQFHKSLYKDLLPKLLVDYHVPTPKEESNYNKNGRLMALILQEIERTILMCMFDKCKKLKVKVGVLVFDGMMIENTSYHSDLIGVLEDEVSLKLKYQIRLSEKSMDTEWIPKVDTVVDINNIDLKEQCQQFIIDQQWPGKIKELVKHINGVEGHLENYDLLKSHHKSSCPKCKKITAIFFLDNNGTVCIKCKNCEFQFPDNAVSVAVELDKSGLMKYPLLCKIIFSNTTINNYNSTDDKFLNLHSSELLEISDNPIINKCLYSSLSTVGKDDSLIQIGYELFKNKYIYSDKNWYMFDGIIWVNLSTEPLEFSNEIIKAIKELYERLYCKYKEADILTSEKMSLLKNQYDKMDNKLSSNNWYQICINLGKNFFLDREFVNKLNLQTNIICFNNCSFDLSINTKKENSYLDYSTLKFDFDLKDSDSTKRQRLLNILKSIIPNTDDFHYIMKLLSSCLSGDINDQFLHIWTGNGSNGKSFLVKLIEKSFGMYSTSLKTSILTDNGITNPDNASTSLNNIENKRIVTFQEMKKGAKLNESFVKQFTGGDSIQIRRLHHEEKTIIPQHKSILCCNDKPEITGTDYGIWRRLRVVHFPVTFLALKEYNKCDDKTNKGLIDTKLEKELPILIDEFILMLIEYHPIYQKETLVMSENIIYHSKKYNSDSDFMSLFIEECCVIDKHNDKLKTYCKDVNYRFKSWINDNDIDKKYKMTDLYDKIDLLTNYNSRITKVQINGKRSQGWVGLDLLPYESF